MAMDFKLLQGQGDLHVFLRCDPALARQIVSVSDDLLFRTHSIPKRGGRGGTREVWEVHDDAVAEVYKGLARRLEVFFRRAIAGFPHDSVHGYLSARSTRTNALAHIGAKRILKADIRQFFRSIRKSVVVDLFKRCGLGAAAADVLASVVSRKDHLPLGLHTSPILANAVCHDMDCRLAGLTPCLKYTRYADDLTFSGKALPSKDDVERTVGESGFALASEKWRVVRAGRGLYVTGLSLEDFTRPRVPTAIKQRLRQDLFHAEKRGLLHHLGRRGCANVQSGVNHIDGMIRYLRGIEPAVGDSCKLKWDSILKKAGIQVAYQQVGAAIGRQVEFVVDESVVKRGGGKVMVVALAIVEDVALVGQTLSDLLLALRNDPDGGTDKSVLAKVGIHWTDLEQNDRTKVVEVVRALPFRCFVAFAGLSSEEREPYEALYRQLVGKLVRDRLIRYAACSVRLLLEENNKVSRDRMIEAVAAAYRELEDANARRPSSVPQVLLVPKLAEATLPLADVVLGVFGDYATSGEVAAADGGGKKKKLPGDLARRRFEQIRDKVRAVFDVDRDSVNSRRRPFVPW